LALKHLNAMSAAYYWTEDDIKPETIKGNEILDGTMLHKEGVKGSMVIEKLLANKRILGGYEDCLDVVRGKDFELRDLHMFADQRTRTFITLKGGIQGYTLRDITLEGETRWPWDVSLGDWTDYDLFPRPVMQHGNLIRVRHITGRPVRVLLRWCDKPIVHDSNIKFLRLPKGAHMRWHRFEWAVRRRVQTIPTYHLGQPPDFQLREWELAALR
jgi:hypothetical protein